MTAASRSYAHPAQRLAKGEVPSLDGLRAVSVLIVMVSHAGLGWIVPGGFGVTMFFFISGFIITTLLLREEARRGDIDVTGFYARRALRLYPALAAYVAAIVLVYAATSGWPDRMGIAGGFLYFMNYLVIFAPPHVLPQSNHLWSLAVEAHFYLVYPWLFIALMPSLKRLALALAGVIILALAIRIGAAVLIADKHLLYEYAYQASEARLDSIAWGALLSVLLHRPSGDRLEQALTHPALVAAAAAVLAATFLIRSPLFRDTFRYTAQGLALMPLIAAAVHPLRLAPLHRLLNTRAMLVGGWLSYSLYLWHPALFALADHVAGKGLAGTALGFALALAVAGLSYWGIERPMLAIRARFGSQRETPETADAKPSKPSLARSTP